MTIAWKVDALEARVAQDGLTNVVTTVHWRANADDGQYSATRYGSVAAPAPDAESFTPFDQLDEATVIGWAKAALGEEKVTEIETALANELAALAAPSTITPALPWA